MLTGRQKLEVVSFLEDGAVVRGDVEAKHAQHMNDGNIWIYAVHSQEGDDIFLLSSLVNGTRHGDLVRPVLIVR